MYRNTNPFALHTQLHSVEYIFVGIIGQQHHVYWLKRVKKRNRAVLEKINNIQFVISFLYSFIKVTPFYYQPDDYNEYCYIAGLFSTPFPYRYMCKPDLAQTAQMG